VSLAVCRSWLIAYRMSSTRTSSITIVETGALDPFHSYVCHHRRRKAQGLWSGARPRASNQISPRCMGSVPCAGARRTRSRGNVKWPEPRVCCHRLRTADIHPWAVHVGTAKLSAVGSRSSELSSMLQKTERGSREQLPLAHISDHNHRHAAADPIALMGWRQMPRSAFAR
jgi:hypothetical protein